MAARARSQEFAAFAYHGGALDVARRLAPDAPEPWIDLSTGINPHAYPLPDLEPDVWSRLPAADALAALEAAAARRYGAPPEAVVAGPGSQALIQALARTHAAAAPSACWDRPTAGTPRPSPPQAREQSRPGRSKRSTECDVAIVVNPNNPDGRIARRADLLALHERLDRRGGRADRRRGLRRFRRLGHVWRPFSPRGARSSCARSARLSASRA